MARRQPDQPLRRLARRHPGGGHFNAVVHRIAQQVRQRRVQLLQDVAVHLRGLAFDLQPHLLAQRAAQVADHTRQAAHAIAEGPHAAGQRGVVQALGQVAHAPAEFVDLTGALRKLLLALIDDAIGVVQRGLRASVQRLSGQGGAHAVQRLHRARLHAAQAQHGRAERRDPVRFDQRFAGEAQQFVERVRGHAQHALAIAQPQVRTAPSRQRDAGLGGRRLVRHLDRRREIEGPGRAGRRRRGLRRMGRAAQPGDKAVDLSAQFNARRGHALQQVGAQQQGVDIGGLQAQAPFLRLHQAVFHGVRDAHRGVQVHDAGGALERMRRPHAGFQLRRRGWILLQRQQAVVQHLHLGAGLELEQFQERRVAHLFRVHARLRSKACISKVSSNTPTARPPQRATPREYFRLAPSTVAGRASSRPRSTA
ncbi:hypothetical protein D9M68_593870 [compost metagenome]